MKNNFSERKYYPFLDGFRAIAVLWVLSHHINYFFELGHFLKVNSTNVPFAPALNRIFELGFLGVDIFFVISGFLITGLLIDDLDPGLRLKRFYFRRMFKIIPQYFSAICVGTLLTVIFGSQNSLSIRSIISYFLFVQNYIPMIPILGHMWSIAIEEHFYLIYPLVILTVCKIQKDPKSRRSLLIWVLLILIIIGNILRYYFFCDISFPLTQMTHVRFDALLFGCILKLLEPYFCSKNHNRRFMAALYFIVGGLLFISFLESFNRSGWFSYTLVYIASGCLLISALTGFTPLKNLTENKLLRWIGKNSYGIYLWHYILLFLFLEIPVEYGEVNIIVAYIIFSIILGSLTTITIERYFLNMRKKFAP